MAELLSEDAIMELIRSQYPELLPILGKAGVHDALFQAVENNWSAPRLQAALQATDYYRTTSAPQRSWDILSTVDPATAKQQLTKARSQVDNIVTQLGVQWGPVQSDALAQDMVINNWTQAELQQHVEQLSEGLGLTHVGGAYQSYQDSVMKLAADYGVPMSSDATTQWANKLAQGAVDLNAVQGYMIQQAKSMYPGMTGALDAGVTVAQYADPYKQIAARELNINPNDVNFTDSKWNAALSQIDPKTGSKVPMSLDQWQSKIRTDPTYGYDMTQNGQAAAASLTTALAQKMGAL